jgi:thrombospondin type 3 repeat protein
VTFTLTLDATSKGVRLSRQTYSFTHAINADRDTRHYSTDFPGGGREVRDLNRNLLIDQADVTDPFQLISLPDEDVTFSSMFVAGDSLSRITNSIGEDLNNNGLLDPGEDVQPDTAIDPGILAKGTSAPSAGDRIPWNFDQSNGGWIGFRHPSSSAPSPANLMSWEYKTSGLCGFQTSGGLGKFGIWHTGDGDPTTPSASATACDDFRDPTDTSTPTRAEIYFDVLESPIISKVNQLNDARGFPFTVEFQRFAANFNLQTNDAYAGGGVNIVNDVDNETTNCMLCQEMDLYYTRRFGGWNYTVFKFAGVAFFGPGAVGINPGPYAAVHQRTFGPYTNPDHSSGNFSGDETGFTGHTQNNDYYSQPIIPTQAPDFIPFPVPDAGPLDPTPVAGVCTGGDKPGSPCQTNKTCINGTNNGHLCTSNGDCTGGGTCFTPPTCPGGGVCTLASNTVAGPVRNFEGSLVGYEGGFSAPQSGIASIEAQQQGAAFIPGKGGNRWQIGIGFFAIESGAPTVTEDYGFGVDDVVFEWDETHPLDETQFSPSHAPACARFGQPGQPGGLQCATVTVDRTNLYECEESVEVTVFDPNKLNALNVQVSVTTDSDSVHVTTQRFTVNQPGTKRFTLLPAGTPGLYKGNITFSSQADNPTHVFTNPGTDATFTVYYSDPTCDGDGDGQAGEIDFANLDGDGIADDGDHDLVAGDHPCRGGATVNCDDNCPLIYNPTQADADNDGVGDLCDNCPGVYQRVCSNRTSAACQTDADCLFTINGQPNQGTCRSDQTSHGGNGVGDACAFDDVDGDGVQNLTDNCPDVYNPGQETVQGSSGRGIACSGNGDLDGDGIADKSDNCVLTYNPTQSNLDLDKLGDACDGDCPNITVVRLCSNAPGTLCTADANCPAGGFCQTEVRHSAGSCSFVDNDADADGVTDALDNCPTIYNPAIIPGTTRQLDTDRDGLGDACDPDGSQDDDFNGIPDDLPQFSGTINCKISNSTLTAPLDLAKLVVTQTDYKDINGDQDSFPDPGEYGRVKVVVRNLGSTLTGVTFHLTSSDPDVACINSSTFVYKGCSNAPATPCTVDANCPAGGVCTTTIPAGAQVTLSDFDPTQPVDPNQPGFFFTASTSLKSLPGSPPAKVTLCLTATANEALGVSAPVCFNLQADVNLKKVCSNAPATICTTNTDCVSPGVCQAAGQTFTAGPQGGVPGTLFENFDTDANPDGNFTVADTFFHQGQTGIDTDAHGSFLRGGDSGINVIAGVACFGYTDPQGGNQACILNPAFPMDWHFHCAHGDARCPNTESGTITGSCKTPTGTACSFNTPLNGARGLAGGTTANSLEMGVHTNDTDSLLGDTVHLRTLAAFVSAPMNLAVFPRPGDLVMSFYQIADLCTGGGNCVSGPELGYDNADVQIRLDTNPDPATDDWGFWDKLVPFENVYDHKAGAYSSFTPIGYYCNFTPGDTGTAPPAPRGVHETMCFPMQIWSKCGDIRGTSTANTRSCAGGSSTRLDPSGRGVWVQSKFNLQEFLGQRVQIRWIGQTWMFDAVTDDYIAAGSGFNTSLENDGWWIDEILVTGTITDQVAPVPDNKTPPAVVCSAPSVAGACNPALGTDHGTTVILQATDAGNNVLDGVSHLAVSGQALRLSAVSSTIPGGCVNGVAQFQFFKNGVLVQDWSSKTFLEDSPEVDTVYGAKERCSSDPTDCTSQNMVQTSVQVYRGDSSEIQLTVTLSGGNTVLTWPWRPQPYPMAGYGVFRGPLPFNLATLVKASCAVAQPAIVGTPVTYQEATAAGSVYYLVGHRNAQTAGSFPALGLASNNSVIVSPISCP